MILNRSYPPQIARELTEGSLQDQWQRLTTDIADLFPGSTWEELAHAIKILGEVTSNDRYEDADRAVAARLRREGKGGSA